MHQSFHIVFWHFRRRRCHHWLNPYHQLLVYSKVWIIIASFIYYVKHNLYLGITEEICDLQTRGQLHRDPSTNHRWFPRLSPGPPYHIPQLHPSTERRLSSEPPQSPEEALHATPHLYRSRPRHRSVTGGNLLTVRVKDRPPGPQLWSLMTIS